MASNIYTFWEGHMPAYLELCMQTWKMPYTLLTYSNLHNYTDALPAKVKALSLPKIADYIRVHVLRDSGGYWIDADTIMLSSNLPSEYILGNNKARTNTIGFLHTEKMSQFFVMWAAFQDYIIKTVSETDIHNSPWNIMGNLFTDNYLKEHIDIPIGDITLHWPEVFLVRDSIPRIDKYIRFYFSRNNNLAAISHKSSMLMLHNSWTPESYKSMSQNMVLQCHCTLSNILRELL